MIKDSSANKTGVICSSYEIIASLVLEMEEFLKIKERYIKEVIEILRNRAQQEATLLLNTKKLKLDKSLTELSKELSSIINNLTDMLLANLLKSKEKYLNNEFFNQIILRHCPEVLQNEYSYDVIEKLPDVYKIAIFASYCASYLVYTEGMEWINSFSKDKQFEAIISYMKNDAIANQLIDEITKTEIKDKDRIAAIIKNSGAYALTNLSFK